VDDHAIVNVIFHYHASPPLKQQLALLAEQGLKVSTVLPRDRAGFASALPDCEVLWHVLEPITHQHISIASSLRLIHKVGVGLDTIDLEAARARNIAVCNLPGSNSHAVAEHTLALMLATLRKIALFDTEVRNGKGWSWPADRQGELGEIGGRIIGLVGYGAVPRHLAPALRALGAEILYTSRLPVADAMGTYMDLEELLGKSDIISLHLPLSDETKNIIDDNAISRMKTGAILINTARGGLVDEVALVRALRQGKLGAAGLDTFVNEPIDPSNELLALSNVVLTPHVAWLTLETLQRSVDVLVENCRRLSSGDQLLYQVV